MIMITKKVRNAAKILVILTLISCGGKEVADAPYLRLEGPVELAAPEGGVRQEYVVKSNGQWEIIRKSVQTWAEARPASGENDGSFQVTVEENKSGRDRSVRFTFLLNGEEVSGEEISIAQVGNMPAWNEKGEKLNVVKLGIPAYDATIMEYRRDGNPILEVEMQAPVVVASATKPEAWGYFQFPSVYRSAGGLLVASWSMAEDNASGYGKGGGDFRVSSDLGKTWNVVERAPASRTGLFFPSGDRIGIRTPAALEVSNLQLPAPIASTKEKDGRTLTLYRLSELPEALQGVYLNHWDKNDVWSEIHSELDDPRAVRHADGSLFPVIWWGDMKLLPDNSVIAGIYPMFYENEAGGVDPSGVSFYRSFDKGISWKIIGKIPYRYDLSVDPNGNLRKGFGYTEPAFEILADGTFLCVMRTHDGYGSSPMYISRSSDQGVTWSNPVPFTPSGVLPRLLKLGNGVLVLASGRPGVQIRFSLDGKGEKWTDPFEMLPFVSAADTPSCGYTTLLATGVDSFWIVYSDFKFPDPVSGELRKAIKIREIKVTQK